MKVIAFVNGVKVPDNAIVFEDANLWLDESVLGYKINSKDRVEFVRCA